MARRGRKKRQKRKEQQRVEAAVKFMDEICKQADWRRPDQGYDVTTDMLKDFMRSRIYLLNPKLPCPFLEAGEIDEHRQSLLGLGRRCIDLCRIFRIPLARIEDAVTHAVDEYDAVTCAVGFREGEGILVRRLIDRETGKILYEASRDKRHPFRHEPITWLLTGEKVDVLPARRMPSSVPDDEVAKTPLNGYRDEE
jgi:hypothetical protein